MATKKVNIYKRKRTWAGILLAQFLLFYIFSTVEFIAGLFARFFEFQKKFHQLFFAWLPFSLGDILYIILGLVLILFFIKILKKQTRKAYLLKFLILLNLLYFVYQIFWGMLYFQKPILDQLPEEKITVEETKNLTLKYLNLCKQTRKTVKEDRNGVFKAYDLNGVKTEILSHQNGLPKFISNKNGTAVNAFKPSLFKGIMSYTGILGYYNPFTAEAQYNAELPSTYLPFTLAHESSHQLGYAREQEANFIGYLLGKNSEHSDLKYSTEYFVLKSLLNSLSENNPEFVKDVLRQYSPEMKRDRLAEKMFIKKHEGSLDVLFGFTNDLFLKSNQQEGSVTYSYFIDLLVRYERTAQ
ncbi:hypothetical protein CBW16_03245 [Flavobacteriaceae bacterium JJC]|nr:hypothetical protein CBW16_03245 [Flavobacteriaceae bacterium JJC]